MIDLTNLEYSEIERFVTETLREPKFRAKQIFGWIYGGLAKDGSFRSGCKALKKCTIYQRPYEKNSRSKRF